MAALQKTSTFKLPHIFAKSTIIIGLSGGPDSVYLLYLLKEAQEDLNLTLIAAHLDHEWRASSKHDVAFCVSLCNEWNIPLVVKKGSELQKTFTYNGSQEEVGRHMRRFFLESVHQEYHADYIALAHHQDDQLETFFINLIRGTSIAGLGGMKEFDGIYTRPLLHLSKQSIIDGLKTHNLTYQIDPTNSSCVYLRNKIRATIIPALAGCDARAAQNSVRAMESLQEIERFLVSTTETTLKNVIADQDSIDLKKLFTLEPYLQKRVIKQWLSNYEPHIRSSQAYINEIMRFLQNPSGGKHRISDTLLLIKKHHLLSISSLIEK